MVQSLVIEEESGTLRGRVHPHSGYYAGNVSATSSIDSGGAPPRHLHSALNVLGATRTAAAVLMMDSDEAGQGWLP